MAELVVSSREEEEVIVTCTVDISIPYTDDNKRELGLACHAILDGFEFDGDDEGHDILKSLLKAIKSELGVRAPRGTAKKADSGKKRGRPKGSKNKNKNKGETEPAAEPAPETEEAEEATFQAEAPKANGSAVEVSSEEVAVSEAQEDPVKESDSPFA